MSLKKTPFDDLTAVLSDLKRGRMVNRLQGAPENQLHERHEASERGDLGRLRFQAGRPGGRLFLLLAECERKWRGICSRRAGGCGSSVANGRGV